MRSPNKNPKKSVYLNKDLLRQVRANFDRQKLFETLKIEKDQKRSTDNDWWGISPLNLNENTPSFHMLADGQWYCHSTGQGGGPIELIQQILGTDCYNAARWMLDHGASHLGKRSPTEPSESSEQAERSEIEGTVRSEKKKEVDPDFVNEPIRQDLRSALTYHPEFKERGISEETCKYLGCGFWNAEKSKSPLANRIIFQVRGVEENENGELKPVILSHLGRAVDEAQQEEGGKWNHYQGFRKSLELYNIDNLLLDERAVKQAKESGKVFLVEGAFDVAKMAESGIYNVVSSFGSHLSESQLPRIELISKKLGIKKIVVWFDRDKTGEKGLNQATQLLRGNGYEAEGFDWDIKIDTPSRGFRTIPPDINDVCDFEIKQLGYLTNF